MMFGKRHGAKPFFPETIDKVVADRTRSPLFLTSRSVGLISNRPEMAGFRGNCRPAPCLSALCL